VLGIRLVHSKPGKPQGRGKIERWNRTVRDQFLVEVIDAGGDSAGQSLAELNRLFTAWCHQQFTDRKRADYASDLR
jgi:putative transposase